MDEQKDIQNSGAVSRFFDKQSIRTNPFGNNQSAERAYRRTERITAGLYLVTNHILPGDPLRDSVRSGALRLLEAVLSLRYDMRSLQSAGVLECRAEIRRMISLVRMLSVSGFLSTQNTHILIEALDDLGTFLNTSQNSILSENIPLASEDFLDVRRDPLKDIKDIKNAKDGFQVKDNKNLSDTSDTNTMTVRKRGILEILGTAKDLGIRDISSNLPEYSEKMIQRDLVDLVAIGRVKKQGFKRWSRYSLVK